MELGKAIKEIRSILGLTQQEICEKCGLSQGFYSRIENGNSIPTINTLEDIGYAFELPVFCIIGFATQKKEVPPKARACHENLNSTVITITSND